MAETKPSDLRTWAEFGTVTDPGDAKYKDGYGVEIPTHGDFNHLFKQLTQFNKHVNERGIPEWDAVTEYELGAIVLHAEVLYQALLTTSGDDPALTPTSWEAYQANSGGNLIINGGMDVWQRGIVFNTPNEFTADRWQVSGDFTAVNQRLDSTFVGRLAGAALEVTKTNAQITRINQYIELRPKLLANVALSFSMDVWSDQNDPINNILLIGLPSTDVLVNESLPTIAASIATRVELNNFVMATPDSGDTHFNLRINLQGSLNGVIRLTNVKLETNVVATPYTVELYGDVLAACKRYFNMVVTAEEVVSVNVAMAQAVSTSSSQGIINYPEMRVPPAITIAGGFVSQKAGGGTEAATIVFFKISTFSCRVTATSTGLVTGDASIILTDATNDGRIYLDSELN